MLLQIGSFGGITPLQSLLKNRSDLWDVAAAGPAAGIAASATLLIIGLTQSHPGSLAQVCTPPAHPDPAATLSQLQLQSDSSCLCCARAVELHTFCLPAASYSIIPVGWVALDALLLLMSNEQAWVQSMREN